MEKKVIYISIRGDNEKMFRAAIKSCNKSYSTNLEVIKEEKSGHDITIFKIASKEPEDFYWLGIVYSKGY